MLILLGVFIGVLVVFWCIAVHESMIVKRYPNTLLNQYYRLKNKNPSAALKALELILAQDKNHLIALNELSQWLVAQKDWVGVLPVLQKLHSLVPDSGVYAEQLRYVLVKTASYLPMYMLENNVNDLNYPNYSNYPNHQAQAAKNIDVKSTSAQRAACSSNENIQGQHLKNNIKNQNGRYYLMQLGYDAANKGQNREAYQYFQKAAICHTEACTRLEIVRRAQNAMTNLSGSQTKALPTPYYSEIFFYPFSQTRFGLTVTQIVARAGVEAANRWQSKTYLSLRRTQDNQSHNDGQLPQLFEDNVEILAVGGQFNPFPNFPMIVYAEGGGAYDLIYRNREPWRGDLRAGLMYYQEWGARPRYVLHPVWGLDYYSDGYVDLTYFSRYDNNVIGGARTRQGVRLFQLRSSMLNLYLVGRVLMDTRRLYFNNLAEIGPGISIVPSNRFNLQIRMEHINGAYLPTGNDYSHNPYGTYYTNNLILLSFYAKL